jgi:hypothetical protein
MRKRRVLPVLREAEFRAAVAEPGAWVEIECVATPDPAKRYRGEWVFYVVRGPEERCVLVTTNAHERIINTMEGVVAFAATKLELDSVSIPLVAGGINSGMRARPK